MLFWKRQQLAMKHNGLPSKCSYCPCGNFIYPVVSEYFPYWQGLTDYTIGWTNTGWKATDLSEYDPRTGVWYIPPWFECSGDSDNRIAYYFGFSYVLWQAMYGGDPFDASDKTGAKQILDPDISVTPPPYYFNILRRNVVNPINDHNCRYDFLEQPPDPAPCLAMTDGATYQIKGGYIYPFQIIDRDDGDVVIFEGTIQWDFESFEVNILDVEVGINLWAYPIDYGTYPYQYSSNTAPYKVWNSEGDLIIENFIFYEIAQIHTKGCIPDINWAILGICEFSESDCEGCLESVSIRVVTENTASSLSGDCKTALGVTSNGSHLYTVLQSGFDLRSEASAYMSSNYQDLYDQLVGACAGTKVYITGTCFCGTSADCTLCMTKDETITALCATDILDCYSSGENYYKHAILADGQGFDTYTEANEYIGDNLSDLQDELKTICSAVIYFHGWQDEETWFRKVTFRDWDSCLFGSDPVDESDYDWEVDGHYTFTANGDGTATVTEATGNWSYKLGQTANVADLHPTGIVNNNIISNVKRLSPQRNSSCDNGGGDKIYGLLSEEV